MSQLEPGAVAAAVAGFSETQVEAALQLIASGGIVPANRPGAYLCTSSDGTTRYFTTYEHCSCPARGRCKHMCAARMMNVARHSKAA